jgi:predicted MFS family arabinose efflux permease
VAQVRLGLRENLAQFSLLVAVNAFVGAMVGLERSTLPLVGEDDFGLTSSAAVLSFIVAFGLAKSFTNLAAGAGAERLGRRRLLILGWALAIPVPLLIAVAPSWGWIVAANLFLGVNQGLAWSMTVVMKIDLVGPRRRGLALGLNEAAGYGGVAVAAAISGVLASQLAPRDVLVGGGAAIAVIALLLTVLFIRDTAGHVALEQRGGAHDREETAPRLRQAFPEATFRHPALRSCSQAGLVNNAGDALAWGLVPLFRIASAASP